MNELPAAIAAFLQAHNSGVTAGFNDLFTADAIVSDEEREYRGDAIKTWIDGAISKYQPQAETISVASSDGRIIATAQVSGTFPGSPIQLRYQFTLRDGKIAALSIAP